MKNFVNLKISRGIWRIAVRSLSFLLIVQVIAYLSIFVASLLSFFLAPNFSPLRVFCQIVFPYTCHPLEAVFLTKNISIFDKVIQHQLHSRFDQGYLNRRNLECLFSLNFWIFWIVFEKGIQKFLLWSCVRWLWIAKRTAENNVALELFQKKRTYIWLSWKD